MKKKVFVITYGGGHVRIATSVIESLINKDIEVSVLGLTSSTFILNENNIDYKMIKDYLFLFENKDSIFALGEEFIDANFDSESLIDKDEIIAYLGLNVWDLSLAYKGIEKAKSIFKKEGKYCFYPYFTLKTIIEYEKPDAILVTCGQRAEKAAAMVGEEKHIPVIRVVDLLGENDFIPYKAEVCVMNELVKDNILSNNSHLSEANIHITGQPNLEYKYNFQKRNEFLEVANIDKYKKIISFFSQDKQIGRIEILSKMIELAENRRDYLYIYKLHPSESMSYYEKFLGQTSDNIIIDKNLDSVVILEETDVVMTFFSTVGLQAIVNEKPLITINLSNQEYLMDFSKYKCALKVTDLNMLDCSIAILLDLDSDEYKDIKRNMKKMKMPINSSDNIADVIIDSMKKCN